MNGSSGTSYSCRRDHDSTESYHCGGSLTAREMLRVADEDTHRQRIGTHVVDKTQKWRVGRYDPRAHAHDRPAQRRTRNDPEARVAAAAAAGSFVDAVHGAPQWSAVHQYLSVSCMYSQGWGQASFSSARRGRSGPLRARQWRAWQELSQACCPLSAEGVVRVVLSWTGTYGVMRSNRRTSSTRHDQHLQRGMASVASSSAVDLWATRSSVRSRPAGLLFGEA